MDRFTLITSRKPLCPLLPRRKPAFCDVGSDRCYKVCKSVFALAGPISENFCALHKGELYLVSQCDLVKDTLANGPVR